jgi:hypothetical protein
VAYSRAVQIVAIQSSPFGSHLQGQFGEGDKHEYKPEGQSTYNARRIRACRRRVATSGDVREQPKVADAASELLQDVFGNDKSPCRLVYGVASLPLGTPVELEVIFEIAG